MLSLSHVKQHLQTHKRCSLQQLCELLQESSDCVQMLVQHLINKNLVCERRRTSHCGSSCQQCPLASTIMYEWQEQHVAEA